MATTVRLEQVIRCPVETFWRDVFDDRLSAELFTKQLGFPVYRVLERSDEAGAIRRRVEIQPKLDAPGAVKAVLGHLFTYVEAGVFDGNVYRFELVPPEGIPADRATVRGVMRADPTPDGHTRRVIELRCEVRMFGVGGMLERFAIATAEQSYAAHAEALNAWLAGESTRG